MRRAATPIPRVALAFGVVLCLALLSAAAYSFARPVIAGELRWRDIGARGAVRVGIDPNWQPFSFYDARGWNGFDADLMREVARRLGLRLESEPVGYDSLYDALAQDRVDVIASAVVPDAGRTAEASYSAPYIDVGVRLVLPGGCPGGPGACLSGRRIAVALGTDADRVARYWERRAPGMQRLSVADQRGALDALAAGRADGAITSGLDDWADIPSTATSLEPRPFVIGASRDNARLLQEIDRAIADMRQDGTLAAIQAKWLQR